MTGTFSTEDLNKILRQNCFEVFGLPLQYNIDQGLLNSRYQELQKQLHPDKFINHPDSLLSIRVSAHINDAYNTLNSPLLKSIALLQQKGIILDLNVDKELPSDFLMEQMELYEEIEDASHNTDKLDDLAQKLVDKVRALSDKIALGFECIDCHALFHKARNDSGNNSYGIIIENTKKMAFYNKIAHLIDQKIEESW
jgi:Fe-S protein assembly co-chaperone HscB